MERVCFHQIEDEACLSLNKKSKISMNEKQGFKIRPIKSLHQKQRMQTTQTNKIMQKHLMHKKDLLQQKFKNLQLNVKEQKKQLKLRLSKGNKENVLMIKQLNEISNNLEVKLEAQNCLMRKSLDKMEKIISSNVPKKLLEKSPFQNLDTRQQLPSLLAITQNFNKTKIQFQKTLQQKYKLESQLKDLKSVNKFLTNKNQKLLLKNSRLKQKIIEKERQNYDNFLKYQKNSCFCLNVESQHHQSKVNQSPQQKFFKLALEKQVFTESFYNSLGIQSEINENELNETQKINANQENICLNLDKNNANEANDEFQSSRITKKNDNKSLKNDKNKKAYESMTEQIFKLSSRIVQLQNELFQQKIINQSLFKRIEKKKVNLFQSSKQQFFNSGQQISKNQTQSNQICQNHSYKTKQSQISIKITQQKQALDQSSSTILKHKNSTTQDPILMTRISKSQILSNHLTYFSQTFDHQVQYQKNAAKFNLKNQLSTSSLVQSINKEQLSVSSDDTLMSNNDNLNIKILQKPVFQMQQRRRSISNKLNSGILKKISSYSPKNIYSNQKVKQFQTIQQTISLKFQAFKYSYQLFQNQMINWPNSKISLNQLKLILSQFPFFLDESSIEIVLLRCRFDEDKQLKVDSFCNTIKQFVSQQEQMTEEEQFILEKKIYKRWKYTKNQIMQVMKKNECLIGQITKAKFVSVLEEFKFQEKEIHHLLSQSVALSYNINHIKYQEYLQNFLFKN